MSSRLAATVLLVCVVLGSASLARAQTQNLQLNDGRVGKRVTALRITEPIHLDGRLDEEVWSQAETAGDFLQQYPDEHKPARRATDVKFLYDDANLYIGAMLYDDPDALITNDLKRDFAGNDADSFGLILDTFNDKSNSYGFLVNPGGAMRDAVNADAGRLHDPNWHGVWSARTVVLSTGWSLEMSIPFRTLRFPEQETLVMGLNLVRTARRINERSTWSPVPRQMTHYNVSYAGALHGLTGVSPGRNLYVKPFASSAMQHRSTSGSGWDGRADGGLDLKWSMTSSLVMDATWRTDFSQVEADEQQINLTRFSLFFPEKREFFLESPGNFQIGLSTTRRDFVPFFTRNIGLVDGEPVPVVGGVRVTGRAGRQSVGLLNVQTGRADGREGDNFTAALFRRGLSRNTSLGGFYFGRETTGVDGFNRVAGVDFRYTPIQTLDLEAFAMRSTTEGQRDDVAGRVGMLLTGSRHTSQIFFLHIGDGFQHDLGFVPRRGIGTLYGDYNRVIRNSNPGALLRQHTIGATVETTTNAAYDQVLTRLGSAAYTALFKDEGQFTAVLNRRSEHLEAPFTVAGSTLRILPGDYGYTDGELSYASNRSARLSGSARVAGGEFWTGRQKAVGGSLRFRLDAHLAASVSLSRSHITLPTGTFTGDLVGLRVDTSFSPRMFLNAFVQYNGASNAWLSNIRYNLIHRPLSDIYIVWNETRIAGAAQRALLMKYTHLLSF